MFEHECIYQNGRHILEFFNKLGDIEVEIDESFIDEGNTVIFPIPHSKLMQTSILNYKLVPDQKYTTYCFKKDAGLGGQCEMFILNHDNSAILKFDEYGLIGNVRGLMTSIKSTEPIQIEWQRDGILKSGEYPVGTTIIHPNGTVETIEHKDYTKEDLEIQKSF